MTSKLRKTFKYPTDDSGDDDDDIPKHMDEEEQENLITRLRQENEARNEIYTNLFLAVASLLAVVFTPALFISTHKILRLLSITSLLSTCYILKYIPLRRPDPKGKRPMRDARSLIAEGGPVDVYLGRLNGALCGVLSLAAWVQRGRGGVGLDWWALWLIPGALFLLVTLARKSMLSVDVEELEGLRYRYKGA